MAAKKKYEPGESWDQTENPWYQAAEEIAAQLRERPAFSYDPEQDPLYRSARDKALRQGRRAMEDTLGRVSGLTGGYASTYAQSQGLQAYDRQIEKLAVLLPDYYEKARAAYDGETKRLRDELGAVTGLYDLDYESWLDAQKAERWQRDFDRDNEHWEQDFEEKLRRWELEFQRDQERWEEKQQSAAQSSADSAREKERSYAYRMAMLALQRGLRVSDALLQRAGIDKDYAEVIRRYFAASGH